MISTLTVEQVTALAKARIEGNGIAVPASAEWTLALQVRSSGLVWSAQAQVAGRPAPFWVHVDDASGVAEFVMPIVAADPIDAAGKDWLIQVYLGLTEVEYPARFETFLRQTRLTDAKPTGGGRTNDGVLFLDYTLRGDDATPARFEVRCFYIVPEGSKGSKLVVSAELVYVDAATYRYRLVLD